MFIDHFKTENVFVCILYMIDPCCSWSILYIDKCDFFKCSLSLYKKERHVSKIYTDYGLYLYEKKCFIGYAASNTTFYKSSWRDWSNAIYGDGTVVKNNKRRLGMKALAGVTNQSVIKRRYFWCILCVSINSFFFKSFQVCINAICKSVLKYH